MAFKKGGKASKCSYLAKLATDKTIPCAFCNRGIDDELTYGKLYAIGDIQCHYFCVLLSCCLIQKGQDEDGLFGFLYSDILAEVERSKKHRCSYCSREGATLGCSISQCRKQFHLPCGRERHAVSMYYGNYKSFCVSHAPKQKIPSAIMDRARVRLAQARKHNKNTKVLQRPTIAEINENIEGGSETETESVCVICYEAVEGYPTTRTFWPPCCARDAWFHRTCLQRMALSAGMHYLKCPLCNDKDQFYRAVLSQGYYIPDRDAAWELEQDAFADIYERAVTCDAPNCLCPRGRDHDGETGPWDIKLCVLCGSSGTHAECGAAGPVHVCSVCQTAAPTDPTELLALQAVPIQEEEQATVVHRPIMPSRMSLRRTKQRVHYNNASSSSLRTAPRASNVDIKDSKDLKLAQSRQELNLKSPKKRQILEPSILEKLENKLLSPIKMLEQGLYEKISSLEVKELNIDANNVVNRMRESFKKPKPLTVKKKIINNILDELISTMVKETNKCKEPIREWISPKKSMLREALEQTNDTNTINHNTSTDKKETTEINNTDKTEPKQDTDIKIEDDSSNSTFELPSEFIAERNSDDSLPPFDTPKKSTSVAIKDSTMEISGNDIVNIDLVAVNTVETSSPVKFCLKYSPKKGVDKKLDIDVENFKNHYLNEVDRNFKCSFKHKHIDSDDSVGKLKTAIDFAMEALNNKAVPKKRKRSDSGSIILNYDKKRLKRKKKARKLSIKDKNIRVKIKWKKEQLKLKISGKKRKKVEKNPGTFTQYVLNYSPDNTKQLTKPEVEVTPLKKKNIKIEKPTDNLIQTSIDKFFKKSP